MHIKHLLLIIILVLSALGAVSIEVQALPPLPASFYGTVLIDGKNVTPGTVVKALINEQVVASGQTQFYEDVSVYAIDVPGDDPDTPLLEGGETGDRINFMVGGYIAAETAVWQGGTHVELNLTVLFTSTQTPPEQSVTPSAPLPTESPRMSSTPFVSAEYHSQTPVILDAEPSPSSTLAQSIPSLESGITPLVSTATDVIGLLRTEKMINTVNPTNTITANHSDKGVTEAALASAQPERGEFNNWVIPSGLAFCGLFAVFWRMTKKSNHR